MPTISFQADDLDAAAIHRAVAYRQAARINGQCVLPDGESDTLGAVLAEICRDWLEYMERVKTGRG